MNEQLDKLQEETASAESRRHQTIRSIVMDFSDSIYRMKEVCGQMNRHSVMRRILQDAIFQVERNVVEVLQGLTDKWVKEGDPPSQGNTTFTDEDILNADDPAEAAYWIYDALIKGYTSHGTKYTERDAFKHVFRRVESARTVRELNANLQHRIDELGGLL